jgi:tetratricopeptide (TPR) repeat protein
LDTAEQYFQLALEKDPNYALAYTGVGVVWGVRANQGFVRPSEAVPKWKEAIRKSVELDPTLPEAQTHQAGIRFYVDWDWAAAGKELRRAVELAPSFPEAHVWYSEYLLYVAGRLEEGVAEMRRALEMDPHNSLYGGWVGQALVAARRYDEAIAWLQQVLRDDPNMNLARGQLAAAFESKQMYEEALAESRQIAASAGDSEAVEAFDRGYAQGGYRGAMHSRAELAARRFQRNYVGATGVAGYYARAGEKELALDWLEKGYQERETQMVRVKGRYSLRDHPRFQDLLRRMNLPVN